jgi:hypothetical protein
MDIVELKEPIHSREYLADQLLDITNSFGVTQAVFTITRDNASANDVMLDNIEAETYNSRMSLLDLVEQLWSFTQKEGDVRCIGHIINLAVQAALTCLKTVPSKEANEYQMEYQQAKLLFGHKEGEVVSAMSKLQRHIYVFRNRRQFRSALEQQLRAAAMKPHLLTLDMPIR